MKNKSKKNSKEPKDEILEEEYMLGNEYYNQILENAKEEHKEKYK